jgi:N-acetylglucosaminyldiphosphoundecaprenol N-acetyl-beta-D-mannosaminyltransferase
MQPGTMGGGRRSCVIDHGKRNLIGINIDAVDYEQAVSRVISCAKAGNSCSATALAVHGLVTGCRDPEHRFRLNHFDLVVPDGQPVRWAINLLYGLKLPDRVYGPKLMFLLCQAAAEEGIPVFFYGSTQTVIDKLCSRMCAICPGLRIAGASPSEYRRLSVDEQSALLNRIEVSGARLLFAGLGCPRQEVFAYEMSQGLSMPIIAVGAAFDYYAGLLREPPELIQKVGLQWLYRLVQEPRRLWKRYFFTNTRFILFFGVQFARLWRPDPNLSERPAADLRYG